VVSRPSLALAAGHGGSSPALRVASWCGPLAACLRVAAAAVEVNDSSSTLVTGGFLEWWFWPAACLASVIRRGHGLGPGENPSLRLRLLEKTMTTPVGAASSLEAWLWA
jgi:hypothetical protein